MEFNFNYLKNQYWILLQLEINKYDNLPNKPPDVKQYFHFHLSPQYLVIIDHYTKKVFVRF